jgi:hypothetical protein
MAGEPSPRSRLSPLNQGRHSRFQVKQEMHRGIRILQLMQELAEMPEFHLVTQLRGLSVSLYTFDKNYQTLRTFITTLANDPRSDQLFILRNRDQLMIAMNEIIRFLHNYVASALSLIDHTRRLHRQLYAASGEFTDYHSRVASEFTQDPLAQFVKCVRKYCQHYRAPDLAVNESWKQGDNRPTRTFSLVLEDLRTFDGWSATAKKYLEIAGELIDVLEVATEYRDKVIDFYEWFQSRQEEIHEDELRRFREKERELLLLQLDDKVDVGLAMCRQSVPYRRDEVFTSIFTSREFEELDSMPPDSDERATRAIELLEERFFPVPEEIKRKIRVLYRGPDESEGVG